MKFLLISDIHFNEWTFGGVTTRRENTSYVHNLTLPDSLSRQGLDKNTDIAVICGDVFHKPGSVDPSSLSMACQFIYQVSSYVKCTYILTGNHDSLHYFSPNFEGEKGMNLPKDDNVIGSLLNVFAYMPKVHVVSGPIRYADENVILQFMPFTKYSDEVLRWYNNIDPTDLGPSGKRKGYFFMHQGIQGAPLGSGKLLNEDLTLSDFDNPCVSRVFTGHYHHHNDLGSVIVVGPLTPQTWADCDSVTGYMVYDTDTDTYKHISSNMLQAIQFLKVDASNWSDSPYDCEEHPFIDYLESLRQKFISWAFVKLVNCKKTLDTDSYEKAVREANEKINNRMTIQLFFDFVQTEPKTIAQTKTEESESIPVLFEKLLHAYIDDDAPLLPKNRLSSYIKTLVNKEPIV